MAFSQLRRSPENAGDVVHASASPVGIIAARVDVNEIALNIEPNPPAPGKATLPRDAVDIGEWKAVASKRHGLGVPEARIPLVEGEVERHEFHVVARPLPTDRPVVARGAVGTQDIARAPDLLPEFISHNQGRDDVLPEFARRDGILDRPTLPGPVGREFRAPEVAEAEGIDEGFKVFRGVTHDALGQCQRAHC